MKSIDINFSRHRLRHWYRRPGQSSSIAVALALTAGLAAAWGLLELDRRAERVQDLQRRTQHLNERVQKLQRQLPVAKAVAPVLSPARTEALGTAVHKLNTPWRDLFDAVEQATPRTIALLSLNPQSDKRTLLLVAEAATPASMLDYLDRLKTQPVFARVTLTKHEINKDDPNAPYRFEVEVQWKGPGHEG